jgi:1-acyl-sn-glycerol-3-phosphate acyltransferase
LGLGQLTVMMQFHEPVRLKDFGSRKLLAEHCAQVIAEGMSAGLAGRAAAALDVRAAPALAAQ